MTSAPKGTFCCRILISTGVALGVNRIYGDLFCWKFHFSALIRCWRLLRDWNSCMTKQGRPRNSTRYAITRDSSACLVNSTEHAHRCVLLQVAVIEVVVQLHRNNASGASMAYRTACRCVLMCVIQCTCICVWKEGREGKEREREREREREWVSEWVSESEWERSRSCFVISPHSVPGFVDSDEAPVLDRLIETYQDHEEEEFHECCDNAVFRSMDNEVSCSYST